MCRPTILVLKVLNMNSVKFENSPDYENPAIEIDVKDLMEKLSEEYICSKTELRDDAVQIIPKKTDCKTEDCTDLEEISSISKSELEQEEKVRKIDTDFVCVL